MRAPVLLLLVLVAVSAAPAAPLDQVIADLNAMSSADGGEWLFHGPGLKDATAPNLDDSGWAKVRPEHEWQGENAFAWYRKHLKVPERVAGVSVTGTKLVLQVGCDDAGEIYVNGVLAQKFAWDKGEVVLTADAHPGDELVVAVKCINFGGPGRLLSASLGWAVFDPVAEDAAGAAQTLDFARRLASAQTDHTAYDAAVQQAADKVDFAALDRRDMDAFRASLQASAQALQPLADLAHQYTVSLIGHAHIDMDWLWLWPETIDVCNRTWKQACVFMEEFPQFKFSQSQPGAYIAIQKENPELFARMQQYVRDGRWDITGGTWVEGDMNMPSGESIVRGIMLARQYFLANFGKAPEIGWCPDTFGHAWTVPTIMANSGLKYYYFCRCGKGVPLFWWEGPEGSRLLAYNRGGYGDHITAGIADAPLDLERKDGIRRGMIVYGVGDHGGGPTRADINEALRLQKQAVFPKVEFNTTSEFYGNALAARQPGQDFPVIKDELNFTFEGCYTTHADIKRWNRELENTLPVAETLALLAGRNGFTYPQDAFTNAWRSTCFNQFHDIFDGSAIHGSYEYSDGLARDAMTVAQQARDGGLAALAKDINVPNRAGAVPVLVYNPLSWERDDVVTVSIPIHGRVRSVAVTREGGATPGELEPAQVLDQTADQAQVMFIAHVPAVGYAVYQVHPGAAAPRPATERAVLRPGQLTSSRYVLDVNPKTGGLTHLYDRELARDLAASGAEGNALQALWEDPHGMSAWNIGSIKSTATLDKPLAVSAVRRGDVMQFLTIKHQYRSSTFTQELRLYAGLPRIDVLLHADWREVGTPQAGGPMMKVAFPLAARHPQATFEIPYGSIERPCNGAEVPAQKWVDLTETALVALDGGQAAAARPVDLTAAFDQDGIATEGKPGDGDFDDGQRCYPAEMFAVPGGTVNLDGVPFRMPPTADGAKNLIRCAGQRVELPAGKSASLQIMGAAANGAHAGPLTLVYADGSQQTQTLAFSDWCFGPEGGERPGLHAAYRFGTAGRMEPAVNTWIVTIPVTPNKDLRALVLPNEPNLHVVAITRSFPVARRPLYGFSLLNNCKYGFDARDNVLRMTLLRCSYDPDPTPDQGEHDIAYSLVPHAGDWRTGDTVRRAYELNEPLIATPVAAHAGRLPAQHSFATLEPGNLVLTALKRAEDGRGMIARFYESAGSDCVASLRVEGATRAVETNLVEVDKPGAELRADSDGTIHLAVKAHQPRCLRLLAP